MEEMQTYQEEINDNVGYGKSFQHNGERYNIFLVKFHTMYTLSPGNKKYIQTNQNATIIENEVKKRHSAIRLVINSTIESPLVARKKTQNPRTNHMRENNGNFLRVTNNTKGMKNAF